MKYADEHNNICIRVIGFNSEELPEAKLEMHEIQDANEDTTNLKFSCKMKLFQKNKKIQKSYEKCLTILKKFIEKTLKTTKFYAILK